MTGNVLLMLPEILLGAGAVLLLLWDLRLPAEKKGLLCWGAVAVAAAALAATWAPDIARTLSASPADAASVFAHESFAVDGLSVFLKRLFAITAILVFITAKDSVDAFPNARGEWWTLGVIALLGMFLCSGANDFMTLFVSLETVTVAFFALAAFRRDKPASVEAGLKLLVMGSLSAALLLYGIALIYGSTGTVFFSEIAGKIAPRALPDGTLVVPAIPAEMVVGAALVVLGLGFKTSAVPLHVWVPDVYQGAPTPTTAYLSVGSKLAGFVLLIRVVAMFGASPELGAQIAAFMSVIAGVTLLYGNLGALPQTNLKRLMGYSSIAQCGYLMAGIAASWEAGMSSALFYMASYVGMNLAAFAVIMSVSRATGSHEIDDYSGLARRSPMLGMALTLALLSLAGVPPFMGFFGKFFLLGAAYGRPELFWLFLIGIACVVVALYYYLSIVRRIWSEEPRIRTEIRAPRRVTLTLAAVSVVLIGGAILPNLVQAPATAAVKQMGVFPGKPPVPPRALR
ncbi:MAG: NAD(P)H-quinone oxidoreductase subunit 2, chloroplastic [Planctomycetes bacterium]|nr:NAD(P)H-quinone oxidoreductase subunit 2, chloroplastic [Planctomycetota bacterium]